MLDTIIVGVDGRPGGDDALALARRLSQLDDASLVVTCATITAGGEGLRTAEADAHAARHGLARARAHAPDAENITFAQTAAPTPAAALVELAGAHDADLIVVGASHRSAVGRVLGGSVLTDLLRSGVAVAVAPRGYALRPARAWERVAVAVDDSDASDAAVRFAAALTRVVEEPPAEIDIVSVDPRPTLDSYPDETPSAEADPSRTQFDATVARAMAQLPDGVSLSETRTVGLPQQVLADISAQRDVLICGAHGRGTLGRLLFGSVSETVAVHASCPVIIVPVAAVGARS